MAIAKDTREYLAMTVADADNILLHLARLTAELKRRRAVADKKKAEIDLALAADTAEQQREYDVLYERLTEYIQAHPERFIRPCKHPVKGIGTYGLEIAPDKLKILDAEQVCNFSDADGLMLYAQVKQVDNAAVKQTFRDGVTVPGAKYTPPGKVPKIKIDDSYIEQQLKG
jgi:phage host-nuclease inhibitor protein Gam